LQNHLCFTLKHLVVHRQHWTSHNPVPTPSQLQG
jgi:hypothetical protein